MPELFWRGACREAGMTDRRLGCLFCWLLLLFAAFEAGRAVVVLLAPLS